MNKCSYINAEQILRRIKRRKTPLPRQNQPTMVTERWLRITMGAALAAAAVYLLFRLRFALITVTLAAMLAYAILPLVELAARVRVAGRPVPRLASVTVIFILLIVVGAAAVTLAAGPVGDQIKRLAENAGQYRDRAGVLLAQVRASLEQSLPPDLQDTLDEAINRAGTLIVEGLVHAVQKTSEWLSHIVEIIIIPILAFYFLVDLPNLQQELIAFLPLSARQPVLTAGRHLDRIVAGYVRGQIILMILAWLVVWIGLTLLGMRYALLLGIVAGITRGIPIVGPVFGAIPIVGLALFQSPALGVAVLVFFVALQVIESKVVLPLVIGHQLDLHGATILIALLAGNALFGLVGVFLASPVAAFLKEVVTLMDRGFAEPAAPVDAQSGL